MKISYSLYTYQSTTPWTKTNQKFKKSPIKIFDKKSEPIVPNPELKTIQKTHENKLYMYTYMYIQKLLVQQYKIITMIMLKHLYTT